MALTTPLNTVYLLYSEDRYDEDVFLGAFSTLDKARAYIARTWPGIVEDISYDGVSWRTVEQEERISIDGSAFYLTTHYRIDEEEVDPEPKGASS